ncbi:LysR family transcriptional regulator, regulator for metE and metH [Thiothrix caldifontis]|uniref:LysR family transcriptional regulator, regulator for metE and metH n=1 Tax=Thiothrix caldifontis TaxID=525918 RepID=A0A1H4GAE7_9GAMM|nr:LysR substrate-binding domain-containing protein [Thiothrix caldifontis]SEB06633.1 LysR family transcriptional regulator, regulator for metE and metH [Thiothrix caldifontis]
MDIAHLRIIHALHQYQTLGAAAEALCLTQSALSHRMKALEHEIGIAFWNKQGQRLSLTPAGQELLRLALRVLPEIAITRSRLKLMADGRGGRLHVAVECLPCAQWLNPALTRFMQEWSAIDVDVVSQYRFSALPALLSYQIDACLTPDQMPHGDLHHEPLFSYRLCLAVSKQHRLATRQTFTASDLTDETLLTYPVERSRLDVFTQLLQPAGLEPRHHKTVGDTELMLGMVASGRGIALLPAWLLERNACRDRIALLTHAVQPLEKHLWLVVRAEDRQQAWMQGLFTCLRQQKPPDS